MDRHTMREVAKYYRGKKFKDPQKLYDAHIELLNGMNEAYHEFLSQMDPYVKAGFIECNDILIQMTQNAKYLYDGNTKSSSDKKLSKKLNKIEKKLDKNYSLTDKVLSLFKRNE